MLDRLCFMRLNTAGVVIGWLGAVGSLISVVLLSLGLAKIDLLTEFVLKELQKNDPDIDGSSVRAGLLFLLIVYLLIVIINLTASALLILGTVKERHLLLLPWLVNSGISLFFSVVYAVFFFFAQISMSVEFGALLVWLIFTGFGLALHFIIWYAIYSLFKNIQGNRAQQQQLLHPAGSSYPSYTKI